MRVILQRVSSASVTIDGETVGKIGKGFLLLFGACREDPEEAVDLLAKKCAMMRVFEDGEGKMNLSLADVGGRVLIVPNFTLYANCRKGNRPSFTGAEEPERASNLLDLFIDKMKGYGVGIETGKFGADMKVALVNDGPVTIVLDSRELEKSRSEGGSL